MSVLKSWLVVAAILVASVMGGLLFQMHPSKKPPDVNDRGETRKPASELGRETSSVLAAPTEPVSETQKTLSGYVEAYELDRARRYGDIPTLHKQLHLLAEQGNAKAQYELGLIYRKGGVRAAGGRAIGDALKSIEKDYVKAAQWIHAAANQQHIDAINMLAEIYERGEGVEKNDQIAVKHYLNAARLGSVLAQNTMGIRYIRGQGVPADLTKAAEWFKKSAAQGYPRAQLNLSHMYLNGAGVQRDLVSALVWAKIAETRWWPGIDAGDITSAKLKAQEIEQLMSPHKIERARRRASKCVKDFPIGAIECDPE